MQNEIVLLTVVILWSTHTLVKLHTRKRIQQNAVRTIPSVKQRQTATLLLLLVLLLCQFGSLQVEARAVLNLILERARVLPSIHQSDAIS